MSTTEQSTRMKHNERCLRGALLAKNCRECLWDNENIRDEEFSKLKPDRNLQKDEVHKGWVG